MQQLNLGSIQIPLNAATKTFAILAKRGGGKSYTGGVMAEELYKNGIPFVVFDPIDVWYGLRLNKNGKSKGLPIVVFGIEHADIKLDRDMGRRIAQAVVAKNVSCIISTFGMSKTAQRYLIAEFAEELLNINNTARHVFIEEAVEFVPQRIFGDQGRTFNAVSRLVTLGRNRGIGVTLINQRAATINKDVLTQLDTLLAFQNVSPQDRKALKEWVECHAAQGDFDKFMESLPILPKGEGWIWSPEFLNKFERIKIRQRETFHPDREKLGENFHVPALESADIESFISEFSKQEPVKEKIKKDENKVIAESKPIPGPDKAEITIFRNEYESKLIAKDAELRGTQSEIRRLTNIIEKTRQALGGNTVPQQISNNAGTNDAVSIWMARLGKGGAGKILKLLVENPHKKFTRDQLGLQIGLVSKAGSFNNYLSSLKTKNLIIKVGKEFQLNPEL
jgi:hypothetical protein